MDGAQQVSGMSRQTDSDDRKSSITVANKDEGKPHQPRVKKVDDDDNGKKFSATA